VSRIQGNILVIRGGAIGDFILTLPVLAALRQQFPDARVEVLGYPHIARLALAGGLVADVRSIEAGSLAGFFARGGRLSTELVDYFSDFDLIISYLYDPDQIFETNVVGCSGAQFIAGPHRPDDTKSLHATEVFLKPLERLAIFDADTVPRLTVTRAFETNIATGKWLALHPGSGSERKNWPESKWAELLNYIIQSTTFNLLLIGGEAERNRLEHLAQPFPQTRIKQMQSVPLQELAQWMASCIGFVGHDSGISHLAAAVGLPALILWGDTSEAVWRPRNQQLTVLRDSNGLKELSVPVVINHLDQLLNRGA
jgi:heptosyltransferase III